MTRPCPRTPCTPSTATPNRSPPRAPPCSTSTPSPSRGRPEPWRTIPDSVFFDRYGGECDAQGAPCARVGPWLAANATLLPRTAVLVGNPQRLRDLDARERAWVTEAAKQAATYSTTRDGDDARTLSELCAGGVRVTECRAPPWHACAKRGGRSIAGWRPAPTRAQRCGRSGVYGPRRRRPRRCGPCRAASRPSPAATPRARRALDLARRHLPGAGHRRRPARRWRQPVPADRTGTATLTLRRGRWRLVFTEPGRSVRTGTYAGTALRTRLGHRREHARRGLRLDRRARRRRARIPRRVGQQPGHDTGDLRLAPWRRIG